MHYINQFFAGCGGEEKANLPVDFREGPVGPGKRLQTLLRDAAEIVVTAYCMTSFYREHPLNYGVGDGTVLRITFMSIGTGRR